MSLSQRKSPVAIQVVLGFALGLFLGGLGSLPRAEGRSNWTHFEVPKADKTRSNFGVSFQLGLTQTSNEDFEFSSLEFGLGGASVLSPGWALTGEFGQGFLTEGFSTAYTVLGVGLERSLWGRMGQGEDQIRLGAETVMTTEKRPAALITLTAMAKQYFFNGREGVYPLSGAGVCARYRMGTNAGFNPGFRLCYDHLVNPPNTSYNIRMNFVFELVLK